MAFADSQGTRIYYDDRGKGEPVFVCLPGWCVHHTIFVPLAERLSAQHRVQALQDSARWRETVEQLLTMWLRGAPASVNTHIRNEMESHGFEDWARAAREITSLYAREGDPLQALSELSPPVPALHVYAQPRAPEYLTTQESFARDHSWFAVRRLEAV